MEVTRPSAGAPSIAVIPGDLAVPPERERAAAKLSLVRLTQTSSQARALPCDGGLCHTLGMTADLQLAGTTRDGGAIVRVKPPPTAGPLDPWRPPRELLLKSVARRSASGAGTRVTS